jgi:hypothetical protein
MMKRERVYCLAIVSFLAFLLPMAFFPNPASARDVTLAWDANSETDIAGYKIYYGKIPGGPYNGSGSSDGASPIVVSLSSLLNPSSPEFTVHGLAGGTYCFVGTAYDTKGLESFYSNEACTSPPNSPPNLAPILLLLLDD